jgi:glucose/mannose-6-phosphate isomerase
VLALTTGGALAERGRRDGFPVVQFAYPGQAREAIGYSTLLILGVLARLGYARVEELSMEKSWAVLEGMAQELGPDVPTGANAAKQLAHRLHGRLPVIYGGGFLAEVARRWKGQLNENAKHWAFFEQLPELNHNAVLGYRFPPALAGEIEVVFLSSERSSSRLRLREEITIELLARAGVATERLWARGETALQHMLSAIYHGDFVSYYLALLNEADPSNSADLALIKERLAHARG